MENVLKFSEFYEKRSMKVWKQVAGKGRVEENFMVLCFGGQAGGEQMGKWTEGSGEAIMGKVICLGSSVIVCII